MLGDGAGRFFVQRLVPSWFGAWSWGGSQPRAMVARRRQSGRAAFQPDGLLPHQSCRGAPIGNERGPAAQQRFREGSRIFSIDASAEHDPEGRLSGLPRARGQVVMSYAVFRRAQTAVAALSGDRGLGVLVGTANYEMRWPAVLCRIISGALGSETVREAGDGSGAGRCIR